MSDEYEEWLDDALRTYIRYLLSAEPKVASNYFDAFGSDPVGMEWLAAVASAYEAPDQVSEEQPDVTDAAAPAAESVQDRVPELMAEDLELLAELGVPSPEELDSEIEKKGEEMDAGPLDFSDVSIDELDSALERAIDALETLKSSQE